MSDAKITTKRQNTSPLERLAGMLKPSTVTGAIQRVLTVDEMNPASFVAADDRHSPRR